MAKLNGRFYFKKTSNGNLIGEFSNNHFNGIVTESADLVKPGNSNYLGTYNSTWQEKAQSNFAELTITSKPNCSGIFCLEWRGAANFDGEGMLCDDILIGDYHSTP